MGFAQVPVTAEAFPITYNYMVVDGKGTGTIEEGGRRTLQQPEGRFIARTVSCSAACLWDPASVVASSDAEIFVIVVSSLGKVLQNGGLLQAWQLHEAQQLPRRSH